ncbi:MAG: hypothetical protein H0U50_10055, partial [Pyrinomonadaceae bacterium]|nr:hypothetical protein [Pyrinomonadaceae bacterium]
MNFASAKIEETAALYAKQLLEQARPNEPLITEDLQRIASDVSAEIVGLENRFKSQESLTGKIVEKTEELVENLPVNISLEFRTIEKYISLVAELNNDSLRYTFILPFEIYSFSFKKTLAGLKDSGYDTKRIWNAWKNIETRYDKGYRGVNAAIISSQAQKFELQFHTKESFQLKTKTHHLYKMAVSRKASTKRRTQIIQTMVDSAKN